MAQVSKGDEHAPGALLLDEDYPILSTIHSAKGREWNAVSVLNAVDAKAESDDKWAPWASCAALYTIEMTGNALSGWGAMVHVITPEGVTSRRLKGRQD